MTEEEEKFMEEEKLSHALDEWALLGDDFTFAEVEKYHDVEVKSSS